VRNTSSKSAETQLSRPRQQSLPAVARGRLSC
jgi:hypothetical protein